MINLKDKIEAEFENIDQVVEKCEQIYLIFKDEINVFLGQYDDTQKK